MLTSRNTGDSRLHPSDAAIIRGIGSCSVTGGEVDLSRVTIGRLTRRVEREDAPALKARLKREKRARNRSRNKPFG
jgi:hypothetical protein